MSRLLLFALLFATALQAQDDKTAVLFIGNSYTGTNNLPQVFANFSNAAGDSVIVESNTPGGFTLDGHSTNAQTLAYIGQGGWDYVALQEQSQIPSFPLAQVQNICFPFATALDQEINAQNACAETVFYMTWGRENGDASNCSTWPPVCTYEGMDSLLHERYMQMAEDNDAIVSPVGAVWKFIRSTFPSIDLYTNDGSHPSQAGTYAAACSFYTVIHRKDPTLVAWDYNLSPLQAYQIRIAAKEVVFDSLERWFVGEYDTTTVANFDFDTTLLNVQFTNTSANGSDFTWLFGDGDSSNMIDPLHTYDSSGTFDVTLISEYCNLSDTITKSIIVFQGLPSDTTDTVIIDTMDTVDVTNGIRNLRNSNSFTLFPNPVSEILSVQLNGTMTDESVMLLVYDMQRKLLLSQATEPGTTEASIKVTALPEGSYILTLQTKENRESKRFVIQR